MDIFLVIMGLLPFVLLFALLLGTRIKAHWVTLAVMLFTAVLAVLVFRKEISAVAWSAVEGALVALIPIIWVIFAAVFTYYLSLRTGSMGVIQDYLTSLSPDRSIQAVLIAFCFGGFLESVAGFGTAVAIPTGMLAALGFHPVRAAVITLLANSVPVAFGALGIPVIVLARITDLSLVTLTRYVALQLLPFALIIPAAVVLLANGSLKGAGKALREAFFIGAAFTLIQTLTAFLAGPELVAVAASLGSLFLYLAWKTLSGTAVRTDVSRLLMAVSNYGILLVLVLITRLLPFGFLKAPPFQFEVIAGGHKVTLDWLTTPGTLLFISSIAGGYLQGARLKAVIAVVRESLLKIVNSAFTILNIVILAKIMGNTGMIAVVAQAAATLTGPLFPLFSPLIGAAGTFVTGSDTSSNILLGQLQKQTAIQTGADPSWIAAANTSGATAGKMISPQSISVAVSTVGMTGVEREIIRSTIVFCLAYTAVLGLYIWIVELFL